MNSVRLYCRLHLIEQAIGSDRWELARPLVYEVDRLGSGLKIIVPAGFVSDGASVPFPFNAIVPRMGRARRAGFVHDFLWREIDNGASHACADTYRAADDVFHEALIVSGVLRPVAAIMYLAVRFHAWRTGRD